MQAKYIEMAESPLNNKKPKVEDNSEMRSKETNRRSRGREIHVQGNLGIGSAVRHCKWVLIVKKVGKREGRARVLVSE